MEESRPTNPSTDAFPKGVASAEHIATHDRSADVLERVPQYVVVCSRLAATRVTVNRSKRL
jgi:hypothetical protein